jgi:UDP-glucose 4-epimerase
VNGQVFNLGGDCVISLKDLANLLIEVHGAGEYTVQSFPPNRRGIDIGDYYANFSCIRSVLQWEPEVPLREGLARTLEFYRKYLEHYR